MHTVTLHIREQDRQIAGLTTLAISLHMLEAAFPSPLPGVKPGIANIVVLFVCARYGFASAASVSLLRVFASSLLFGQLLTPGFFLSLAGAITSLGMLWLTRWLPSRHFSAVSISILTAMAHVLGQVLLVRLWLIPLPQTFLLLPPLLLAGIVFGLVNGLIVNHLLQRMPVHH
ncbi:MAG TPA: Gx transporter family protein [Methylophilus sp.]